MSEIDDALDAAFGAPARSVQPAAPVDQALDLAFGAPSANLRTSLYAAQDVNPDTYAEQRKLAKQTGLQPDFIGEALPEVKRQAALDAIDYDDLIRTNPALASWLADPDNAKVARDDLGALGAIGKALQVPIDLQRSVGANVVRPVGALLSGTAAQYDAAVGYMRRGLGAVLPQPAMDALETPIPWWLNPAQVLRGPGEQVKALAGAIDVPQERQNLATDVAGGLAQVGTQISAMLMSPVLGFQMLTSQGADIQYDRATEAGATPEQRDAAVLAGSAVTAATEAAGLKFLMRRLPERAQKFITNKLVDVFLSGGAEALQEVTEGVMQNAVEAALYNPEKGLFNWEEMQREALAAGGTGAAARVIINAILPGRQALQAEDLSQRLQAAGTAVDASKLNQRDKDALRDLVRQQAAAGQEQVFLQAADWDAAFAAAGVDPEQAYQQFIGDMADYREARTLDGLLTIPIERFLVDVPPAVRDQLRARVRATPDGLDAEQSAEVMQQVEAASQRAVGLLREVQAAETTEARETIYNDLLGQLLGVYDRGVAERNAQIETARFLTMASRLGLDPVEYYRASGLQVGRQVPAALRGKLTVDTELDPLLDRLRVGDIPSQTEAFGLSLLEFVRARGISDDRGDLRGRDIDKGLRPFQRRVLREDGMTLDKVREAAVEAGYLPEDADINALLDALDDELRGAPRYSERNRNSATEELRATLEALSEELDRAGVDVRELDNEAVKRFIREGIAPGQPVAPRGAPQLDGEPELQQELFEGDALEQRKDGPRGSITLNPSGVGGWKFRIDLSGADLSTFQHEMGHFWLEQMKAAAAMENAPQQVHDDYQKILAWLGNSADEILRVMRAEARRGGPITPEVFAEVERRGGADYIRRQAEAGALTLTGDPAAAAVARGMHEYWARGSEAYLFEGKAPTPGLRDLFGRFRAWLIATYRELRRLNVTLTDDVRRVMDRLVATDDEIMAAAEQQHYAPLFTDPADFASAEDWQRYQAQAARAITQAETEAAVEMLKPLQREQEAWYRERRAEVLAEVEREVNSRPDYQAQYYLRTGRLLVGSLPDGHAPLKLSKRALEDSYGAEFLKRLTGMYRIDGGVHPDVVADRFGFRSGNAMIEALVNLKPRREVIEAETDERLRERYGDPATDGSLPDKVMRALHNDSRAALLLTEIRKLSERSGRPVGEETPYQLIRQASQNVIRRKRVRDLQPNKYRVTEAKAARQAFEAAAAGRFDEALQAKQRQLWAHELYRAARDAVAEVESIRDYGASFGRKATREMLGKAGWDYLDQVDAITNAYEFRRVPLRDLDRRVALRDWIEARLAEDKDTVIPEAVLQRVEREQVINYRSATYEELLGVRDSLRNIEALARLKTRALKNREEVETGQMLDEIRERLEAVAGQRRPLPHSRADLTAAERLGADARDLATAVRRPETLIEWLDGGETGPLHDYLWNQFNEAQNQRDELREQVTRPLQELADRFARKKRASLLDKVRIEALDRDLSRKTLISIALNLGNSGPQSNQVKLMEGGYVINGERIAFTEDAIAEIKSKLSRDEWEYVQTVWDTVNSLWPRIVAFTKRMTGIPPEKVEAVPFTVTLADGSTLEMKGGYYPVVYDPRHSVQGEKQAERKAEEMIGGNFTRASTPKGHLKARTTVARPLLLDFEQVLARHVDNVITDLTHREPLIQANKILNDKKVRSVIQESLGDSAYRSLQSMVRFSVNADYGANEPAAAVFDRAQDFLLRNTAIAALGFRVATAAGNLLVAPIQAAARVSPAWILRGMGRFYAAPRQTRDAVWALSPYMRHRHENLDATFVETLAKLRGEHTLRAQVARASMEVHRWADFMGSTAIWLGRFEQARSDGLSDDEAVALADKAIRQTQTAGAPKDLSAFERDPRYKWSKLFLGPMVIMGNRIQEAGLRRGKVKSWPEALGALVAVWFLPAVLFELATGRGPDDEDDEDVSDEAVWALRKVFFYPFATIPIVRDAANMIERAIAGEAATARMNPIADVGYSLYRFGAEAVKAGAALAEGEEVEGEKVVKAALRASGPLVGLPTGQLSVTGDFLYDLATGDYQPEGPLDARYLFVRRER